MCRQTARQTASQPDRQKQTETETETETETDIMRLKTGYPISSTAVSSFFEWVMDVYLMYIYTVSTFNKSHIMIS